MKPSIAAAVSIWITIALARGLPPNPDRHPPPIAQAVPELPAPTGPFAIGTRQFSGDDAERLETLTDDPSDHRELLVQIWYPAMPADDGLTAPYVYGLAALADGMDAREHAVASAVTTHAHAEADLLGGDEPLPVILFSHGLGGTRSEYTSLAENLASHGYVVVGIDHLLDGGTIVIPDGRVVRQAAAWSAYSPAFVGVETAFRFRDERSRVWAQDAAWVLDRLTALDRAEPPSGVGGRFDLSRVGYFGHSLGGTAVVMFCEHQPRVSACANLDGWPLHGDAEGRGLSQPYLHMEEIRPHRSDELLASWETTRERYEANMAALDLRTALLHGRVRAPSYHLRIDGIVHRSFSDRPLLFPWEFRGADRPTIDAARALEIVNAHLLQFFDRHLRGRAAPSLDGEAATYPETRLVRYAPRPPASVAATLLRPGLDAAERLEAQQRAADVIEAFARSFEDRILARPAGLGVAALVVGPELVWVKIAERRPDPSTVYPFAGWEGTAAQLGERVASIMVVRSEAYADEIAISRVAAGLPLADGVPADSASVQAIDGSLPGYSASFQFDPLWQIGVLLITDDPPRLDPGAEARDLVLGLIRALRP